MSVSTDDQWKDLYRDRGFFDETGQPLSLPHDCPRRKYCWEGCKDDRLPDNEPCSTGIYRPWVGSSYEDLRLAIIGINMNEYGGFYAMHNLVKSAKKDLQKGKRMVRFDNDWETYHGTLVFHRAGSYAVIYAASRGLVQPEWTDDHFPVPNQVSEAFDFVAMTNRIKCSPRKERSAPARQMWRECVRYVLRPELAILKPSEILFLGLKHFDLVLDGCLDAPAGHRNQRGRIRVAIGSVGGERVRVIGVPHPHARGYDVKEVLTVLKEELSQNRPT